MKKGMLRLGLLIVASLALSACVGTGGDTIKVGV